MGWLRTIEIPQTRQGGITGMDAKREYVRKFKVQYDNYQAGSVDVSVAPGIPSLFSLYIDPFGGSADFGARCYDVQAIQDEEDPFLWLVTAKYSSGERSRYSKAHPEKGDSSQQDQNPLNRPAIIVWGSRKLQKVVERCSKMDNMSAQQLAPGGTAFLLNSAGDPFDPPITIEDTLPTLTIIRNEATFDPGLPVQYHDAVNIDTFWGAPPYCAKIESITGRSNTQNNMSFYEVTYEIHFTRWNPPVEKGWLIQVCDRGFYAGVGQNRHRIVSPLDGTAVVSPAQLDGNGNENPNNTPFYFTCHIYPELAFAPLALG